MVEDCPGLSTLELSSVVLDRFKLDQFWQEFVRNVPNTVTNQEAARSFHAVDCDLLFEKFKKGEKFGSEIPEGFRFLSALVFESTWETKRLLTFFWTDQQIEELEEDLFSYIFGTIGGYFENFEFVRLLKEKEL